MICDEFKVYKLIYYKNSVFKPTGYSYFSYIAIK